jgi:molybdenum cofactor cytidylyltransferase
VKFETLPVDAAAGCVLAHSLRVDGRRWSKGRRLEAEDLPLLREAGLAEVTVARLEATDVGEDAAAAELAAALAGPGVEVAAAFTGRCNLYAAADGISTLDVERLNRLNRLDEALTVATVAPFEAVHKGQMLATVKVIPFAVERALLARALGELSVPAVKLAPFRPRKVGLILTELPGFKESLLEKAQTAVRGRLAGLGGELVQVHRCTHDTAAVATALQTLLAEPEEELLLIFAASAVTDRRDVIPAALEQVGGTIERFGMPVDPGNLLLLGRHGERRVVVLPGCARSPKLNGLDWVLRRIFADLPLDSEVISDFGVGGLLQEIHERPQPRGATLPDAARRPRIAALVLAAGHSRRMGAENKLLAVWRGQPLLRHAVDNALASEAQSVYVITGHDSEAVAATLAGLPVVIVHNLQHASGLATSLQAGLRALPDSVDGVLVCLGDMPRVRAEHLDRLIAAFAPLEGRAICLPTYRGKRGNPALLGRQLFEELAALEGDRGARRLIDQHGELVAEVPVEDAGVLLDVDTPAALAELVAGGPAVCP